VNTEFPIRPLAELTQRLSPQGRPYWPGASPRTNSPSGATPHDSDANDTAQHLAAELAANAVTHGRVPGRDFELRLALLPEDTLRIEVSDACGDRELRFLSESETDGEGGRGLIPLSLLARTWGVAQRDVGRTVRAEAGLHHAQP